MIGFSCTNCGHTFSVQDQYEGQRIKCPRCERVGVVVDNSGRIKIICQNCGNKNNVPDILDGQEIQCTKCNNLVVTASLKKEPAEKTNGDLPEKSPETLKKSEISERRLLIIICTTAAAIVAGLIIIVAVITSYRSLRARKSQEQQSRHQANDTQPTEQIVQRPSKDTLREDDSIVSWYMPKFQRLEVFFKKYWPLFIGLMFTFGVIMIIRSLVTGNWDFWKEEDHIDSWFKNWFGW